MSNLNTDSLKSKIFESYLEWEIEKFNEYSKCNIESIVSRKVHIEGTNVYWTLSIHPHHDDFVSLSLQIRCKKPLENEFFKIEVKTDVVGHQNMSPLNHHLNNSEYMAEYPAVPELYEPNEWNAECENIDKRTHLELYKENFIKVSDLQALMYHGTLRLLATVWMKSDEIIGDHIGDKRRHKFH